MKGAKGAKSMKGAKGAKSMKGAKGAECVKGVKVSFVFPFVIIGQFDAVRGKKPVHFFFVI